LLSVRSFVEAADAVPARPNILFIMSDDHAAHAIGAYGSKVNSTPNIDRLAKEGALLKNCFATNSICTPSRATILTGKYSHLNGVPVFNRFDGSQPTVAKYLQAAGYYTAMIGKWHLGSEPTGFDQWTILPGQGAYSNPTFLTPQGKIQKNGYATDIITDMALDYLKNRPADKPFFMMCHHKAPHREWKPSEHYRKMFSEKHFPEPDTLFDDWSTRTDALRECAQTVANDLTRYDLKLQPPANLSPQEHSKWINAKPTEVEIEKDGQKVVLTGRELTKWKYQRYMQDYLACVQSVDDSVGRLLEYLDKNGLAENTLVIYTSDQGFFLGDHGLYDKRFMYEEALRMPFLARWQGKIKPGTQSDAIAINPDFAPTFLAAAGEAVPADMQGHSLLPLLKGASPKDWRTSMYYRYYDDPGAHQTRVHYGVRTDRYKLIHFWTKDQWELYDLVEDPKELKNIYNDPAHRETVVKLKKELVRLQTELKDTGQFTEVVPPRDVSGSPSSSKPAK